MFVTFSPGWHLCPEPLGRGREPHLRQATGIAHLLRRQQDPEAGGAWHRGRRSSSPPDGGHLLDVRQLKRNNLEEKKIAPFNHARRSKRGKQQT
ncbi:hypothetical protein C4D60_Mb09t11640 [Musa balbisiana]|uniref:Uncharacterized protein n=1 Tax=Musa balbisiana TaxID=52838 RepID=A0A4S8IFT6_MUSBA|nr:hypothetical protein C4D60_Mb09t11640 [Musa balbisiana]